GHARLSYFWILDKSSRLRHVRVFFFQAEDGIRDGHVTGVQTCALPILTPRARSSRTTSGTTCCSPTSRRRAPSYSWATARRSARSEERRVGKEWRSAWLPGL